MTAAGLSDPGDDDDLDKVKHLLERAMNRLTERMDPPKSHESDFHAWAFEQARRLRAGEPIDVENIAEELESLGGSEEQQLVNRLAVLLAHMLKWEFQPDKRSRSWTATMVEQRKRVARLLRKMPSLRSKLDESIADAYDIAVTFASVETMIVEEDFPSECPYSVEQILNPAE